MDGYLDSPTAFYTINGFPFGLPKPAQHMGVGCPDSVFYIKLYPVKKIAPRLKDRGYPKLD